MLKQRERYDNVNVTAYVSRLGDRLDLLSHKFYASPNKWQLIARANGIMYFFDLTAGQLVYIPDGT